MIPITSQLQHIKGDINKRIDFHSNIQKNNFKHIGTMVEDAFNKLNSFSQGGKGVRGGLFILSSQMFGYNEPSLYDVAASLEIFQASLLIHDDIMDNDLLRRGNPSLFAQYIPLGTKINTKDPEYYGKSMAICMGDIGFFLAKEIFYESIKKHINRDELIQLLHKELMIVGLAQMDDVTFAAGQDMPSQKDILRMYLYKTAHYTFSLPFSLGAIMSNQPLHIIKQMEELGEQLGILFQITDDEIGLFSDETISGKPIGSDVRENKKTFIRALLNEKINDEEKSQLEEFSTKSEQINENIQFFLSLIKKYQIKQEVTELTNVYLKKADSLITSLPVSQENKNTLKDLTDFITKRSA